MLAVQAEAAAAFRRKDWVTLSALLRAFDDPQARFAAGWALLEQGQTTEGIEKIQQLFRAVAGPIEVDQAMPWSLWALRQRFGPTQLLEWGLHDALMHKLWLSLTDLPVADSNTFAREWVEPSLLAFMTQLPPAVRPPLPWQLGGSMPMLDAPSWSKVLTWLRTQTKALGVSRAWPETASPKVFGEFGFEMSLLGSESRLRRLARELDAMLVLEDVRQRVPEEVRPQVTSVIFRATPKRVVDAAIVELDDGSHGALVRHVVPAAKTPGKTTTEFAWVQGSEEEVMAAMPAALFEAALKSLRGS